MLIDREKVGVKEGWWVFVTRRDDDARQEKDKRGKNK